MIVCLISANTEWKITKEILQPNALTATPFGEAFAHKIGRDDVQFVHGGFGKIDAAASCQFAVSKFEPSLVINVGTCGGFYGHCAPQDIFAVEKTVVYDLYEKMFDPDEVIASYKTELDLSWFDASLKRVTMATADQDLCPTALSALFEKYGAIAGDWESGAIARVAKRNNMRCLIVRAVSDVVGGTQSAEAYGDGGAFWTARTRESMQRLLDGMLPWIEIHKKTLGRR